MGHRKYYSPRHGSLGFLPRKRAKNLRGHIRSFPRDNRADAPHLTAFLGYKAGMTQILRTLNRRGSPWDNRELVEGVTIVETPPMAVVGAVGYVQTPKGLRALTSVWSPTLSEEAKRRFYKHWAKSKKTAFGKYAKKNTNNTVAEQLNRIARHCQIVRVITHSKPSMVNNLSMKKAHIAEIQINGGDVPAKVKFAKDLMGKGEISVHDIFATNEMIDTIAVTKGKGFGSVVKRWNVNILPRKSHRGNRKVACIGAWHPANIQWTIARPGQVGYHHRTETNKKIYLAGHPTGHKNADGERVWQAKTPFDITEKDVTPMGGFRKYGEIKNDFLLIKGSIAGPAKRPITIRKCMNTPSRNWHREEITLKWIDTSSNTGHGKFQSPGEKIKHYGLTKKQKDLLDAKKVKTSSS